MEITKHPRFQWMAGMNTAEGHRILDTWTDGGGTARITWASSDGSYVASDTIASFTQKPSRRALDLTDAATAGCLQSMPFDDCSKTSINPAIGTNGVSLYEKHYQQERPHNGTNLGEALCAALLTVWGEK